MTHANSIERPSTLALIDALQKRIESCPEQGRREQMLNALDMIRRAGLKWICEAEGGRTPKAEKHARADMLSGY